MTDTPNKPNPGSKAAIWLGCVCPVLDNGHGRGYMGNPEVFVYTAGCPVHPLPEDTEEALDAIVSRSIGLLEERLKDIVLEAMGEDTHD